MDLGLRDRVALVAASSRGLGRAVAEALGAEGCRLIICSRDESALSETAAAIRASTQASVVAAPADLGDPEQVSRVVAEGVAAFGQIDILVTNTGGPPAGRFEDHSREAWEEAVRQNLNSVLNLCREVLPGMKQRRWGRILNITSIAVKQPVDNLILSNAVRGAVTGFARTLANEVATFGVTVNNVLPGYTRTERVEALADRISERDGITRAEAIARWEKEIPMGRLGEPREFAAMVAFLASEQASYITGVSVPVDGGWIRALY